MYYMFKGKSTVLAATSVDLAGTSASNDTVRRMHDDKVALSNKWVLPAKSEIRKEINPLYQLEHMYSSSRPKANQMNKIAARRQS